MSDRAGTGGTGGDVLLRVENLVKEFPVASTRLFSRDKAVVHAVDNVSFELRRGETLGLVGETGCGKSTLARCVTRLYGITSGRITFDGADITRVEGRELREARRDIQMIFQDPYGSLNPRRRVGSIIADPFVIHGIESGQALKRRVQDLMDLVGLNPEHYNRYPNEFSGGQRQRIGVARALALQPKLIVCDEPVSALDVSIQAQIVNLLADLQADFGLTYLFIAHDLSIVQHVSDRVAVMYLGQVAELAEVDDLYARPRHPYSNALLSAVPVPDPDLSETRQRIVLIGDVPSPINPPTGCHFHTRCPKAQPLCVDASPPLRAEPGDPVSHLTACHFPVVEGEDLTKAQAAIEQEEDTTMDVALVLGGVGEGESLR